jgi:pantothenate kinase
VAGRAAHSKLHDMDVICQSLASRALEKHASLQVLDQTGAPQRLLVALAGAPGSGKTTIATRVAALIAENPINPSVAVVSMDGFHFPRAYLDKLPNREEAYVRRGAPWTFDGNAAVELVRRSRSCEATIYAPSFDHALKDPVESGVEILKETGIIIFEGNYLLCDIPPWSSIGGLVDERWFVEVDAGVAKERVARRHVAAGIEANIEDGRRRVEQNDEINGSFINQHSLCRDVVVQSIDEQRI